MDDVEKGDIILGKKKNGESLNSMEYEMKYGKKKPSGTEKKD